MMVRAAEEEAVMKHYILTHPEHFPEPKKVVQWSTRCQAIAFFFKGEISGQTRALDSSQSVENGGCYLPCSLI